MKGRVPARDKQKGMGTLGWLFCIAVVGLSLMLVLKVLPLYFQDYTIGQVVKSLDLRPGIEAASLTDVRTWLNKGLQINGATLAKGESKVSRGSGGLPQVEVSYERRVDFLYNIDLVLSFEHDWKVKSQ